MNNYFKTTGIALAAASWLAFACVPEAPAAVPGRISYQGTLRKSGVLFNGAAAMTFSIVSADGSQTYWTSGSTAVPVTSGLFRYQLGSPNEAQFAAVAWGDIVPYVQVSVEGSALPREPLYTSPYALHAGSAEGSAGSFTARDGDIRISTTSGSRGVIFQDGTVQYTAGGFWSVSGAAIYYTAGSIGAGTASPQARLDVQPAPAAAYSQIWRDSGGVIVASVSASGLLFADGSKLRNLPSGGGGSSFNYILAQNLATGANWISSDGSSKGLNLDGNGNVGVGQAAGAARLDVAGSANNYVQIWRNNSGVIQASMTAQGALYADGSQLRNVARDNLGNHTATQNLNMAGREIVGVSTVTAGYLSSQGAGVVFTTNALVMGGRLGVDTAAPQEKLHVNGNILSSPLSGAGNRCVYVDNSGVLRAKGSDCGLASPTGDDLGDHTATQNLDLGANWLSPDGTPRGLTVTGGNVGAGVGAAATRLDVQAGADGYVQFWRDSGGVVVASMNAAGLLFADASKMRNLPSGGSDNLGDHTATQDLDMAGHEIVGVSTVTAGYLSGQGAGVVFTTNALVMGGRLGVDTAAPQEKLHVNGNILSSPLSGAGNRCVYVDASGVLRAKGSDCGLASPTGDDLGDHTATQNLDMAGNRILNASAVNTAALGGTGAGVQVSTDLLVLNGSLGVNTGAPQEKLHVNGNILSSSLSGFGNRCVYADNGGVLRLSGDACGLAGVNGDNLGDHTLTQNLVAGAHWLSGDGNNEGLLIDGNGNVSVTDTLFTPEARLEVRGSVGGYAQVWRNFAGVAQASVSASGVIYGDASGLRNLPSGADNLGNHTLTMTLKTGSFWLSSDGDPEGVMIDSSGNIGLTQAVPGTRLDVRGRAGDAYAQFWRDPSGVIQASMTAAGALYADGSKLRNLPAGADSLGTHIATMTLQMSGFGITGAGAVTAAGPLTVYSSATLAGLGSPRLRLAQGVDISSSAAAQYGGVYVSTHVYLPAGARFYGDGSGLSGVTDAGALPRSGGTLTGQLTLNGSTLTVNGGAFSVTGSNFSVTPSGNVGIGVPSPAVRLELDDSDGNTATSGLRLDNFSCSGTDKLTADVSGNIICSPDATGSGSGNLVDNIYDTLGAGSDAGGRGIVNLGSVALGLGAAATRLDVQAVPADGYVQIWRSAAGVIQASMTASGALYADGSKLRGLPPDTLGTHTATRNLDLAGFWLVGLSTLTAASAQDGIELDADVRVDGALAGRGPAVLGNLAFVTDQSSAVSVANRFTPVAQVYDNYGVRARVEADPVSNMGGAPAYSLYGGSFEADVRYGNSSTYGALAGVSGLAFHYGGSQLDSAYGVSGIAGNVINGVVTSAYGGSFVAAAGMGGAYDNAVGSAYGVYAQNSVGTAGSTIGNAYAVFAQSPSALPGRITNNFGVFINDQSGFATGGNFNLYSAGGNSVNYLAGRLGIGTAAPAASLQISSAAAYAGDLLVVSTGSSNVVWINGAGEVHATKFFGDGAGLTGISGGGGGFVSPATADLEMNTHNINGAGIIHTSGLVTDEIGSAGGVAVTSDMMVGGNLGVQNSLVVGETPGGGATMEVQAGAAGNAIRIYDNTSANYCTLIISNTTTCTGSTLIGTNGSRALCLACN